MKAAIISPVYAHVHPALQAEILSAGIPWLPAYRRSDLPRARSFLIEEGLRSGAERLIFIDADNVPLPGVLQRLVTTPLVTPTAAIWGIYPLQDGLRWSVKPIDIETADMCILKGEPFGINSGGLGLAVIHRESLLRVRETLPLVIEENGYEWHPFCMPFVRDSEWYGDDRSLCWRLGETGTQLICDPAARAGHAITQIVTSIQGA